MTSPHPTPILVPLRVDALPVSGSVRKGNLWHRWMPAYSKAERFQDPLDMTYEDFDAEKEGVYLHWRLPGALRRGRTDPGGTPDFPTVPNRWLIVRRSETPGTAHGWVVESDHVAEDGTSPYLRYGDDGKPQATFIGRHTELKNKDSWSEPRPDTALFLTALGAGLTAFSMYQPYNEDVFSFHDRLTGIDRTQDHTLSYLVLGWYSHLAGDPLTPPPGSEATLDQLLHGLGWYLQAGRVDGQGSTLCSGTTLAVRWRTAAAPDTRGHDDQMPNAKAIDVGFGQTWADAKYALDNRFGAAHAGAAPERAWLNALNAFHHDTLEHLGEADGDLRTQEEQHRRGFSRSDGGSVWSHRATGGLEPDPTGGDATGGSPGPRHLHDPNDAQRDLDAALRRIDEARRNLFELWWLKGLKDNGYYTGDDFDDTVCRRHRERWEKALASATGAAQEARDRLSIVPSGAFAAPDQEFHEVSDPVVLLKGTKVTDPLTGDTALACRTGEHTLDELGDLKPESPMPGAWCADVLPVHNRSAMLRVLTEFSLLHRALTPAGPAATPPTTLQDHLDTRADEAAARGIRVWTLPWIPLYLEWTLQCQPLAYARDGTRYWSFDGTRFRLVEKHAATAAVGDAGVLSGKSLLTPLPQYAGSRTAEQHADNAPDPEQARAYRELARLLGEGDLLCQTLNGVNAFFRQQAPTAHLARGAAAAYSGNEAPKPTKTSQQHFTPVRAGQVRFLSLTLVDAFGRSVEIIGKNNHGIRAIHCSPATRLSSGYVHGGHDRATVAELPPRIAHGARLRFDILDPHADQPPSAFRPVLNPLCGWLLVNRVDHTLIVYHPDGTAFGQVQIHHQPSGPGDVVRTTVWRALPPRPPAETWTQARAVLPRRLVQLLDPFLAVPRTRTTDDFDDLLSLIDQQLSSLARSRYEHDNAAVLAGRPIAVVRAGLRLETNGTPPAGAKSSFGQAGALKLADHRWPVRLGTAELPEDGLVAYCDGDAADTLWAPQALWPVPPDTAYIRRVVDGDPDSQDPALLLRAGPADDSLTVRPYHCVTLLMDPWQGVRAVTDILPVTTLRLPEGQARPVLSHLKVPFALGPLLARAAPAEPGRPPEVVMPCPSGWTGTWQWTQPPRTSSGGTAWSVHGIAPAVPDTDLPPERAPARAGFLLNLTDRRRPLAGNREEAP
jgi:hypothetical protein